MTVSLNAYKLTNNHTRCVTCVCVCSDGVTDVQSFVLNFMLTIPVCENEAEATYAILASRDGDLTSISSVDMDAWFNSFGSGLLLGLFYFQSLPIFSIRNRLFFLHLLRKSQNSNAANVFHFLQTIFTDVFYRLPYSFARFLFLFSLF